MNKDLRVSESIEIESAAHAIWDALTNPEKIKVYLFGANAQSDWQVGSTVVFSGEFQGHTYEDKGIVRLNEPNKTLEYGYWSGFSGLEDKPENYSSVRYEITPLENGTHRLTWTQIGFASETGQAHTQQMLPTMLAQIKEIAEAEN